MMTKIKLQRQQSDAYRKWARHYQKLYWRGRLLRSPSEFMDSYRRFARNKQAGPLAPSQVAEITEQQAGEDASYVERSKEALTTDISATNVNELSSRFRFAYILQEFLKTKPEIRSVANIGARVDLWSAYLAPRFPHVRFWSVDFQPNLALHNSALSQQPNWQCISGYWLDLVRSGKLRADMYFSLSTTVLMNNVELNVYLDELGGHAKAMAFCEGWWPRADSLIDLVWPRVLRPEQVPKENPYCSGAYANYHHNYISKLEERGFSINLSQIVPYADNFHYLQVVAEKSA